MTSLGSRQEQIVNKKFRFLLPFLNSPQLIMFTPALTLCHEVKRVLTHRSQVQDLRLAGVEGKYFVP